jgi:hypothetical protein
MLSHGGNLDVQIATGTFDRGQEACHVYGHHHSFFLSAWSGPRDPSDPMQL